MFICEYRNKWLLPFLIKMPENSAATFNFEKAIKKVAELGIEPVGLCGDMAFSTIFKSKFSNLTITFDAYHVIMALIKNFSGKFPTFLNMLKLTSETSH